MKIVEVEVVHLPPPPEKARLNTLKREKENISKTIKATKAREKIAQGQQQLQSALKSST